jgi:hypothetical protein
VDTVRLAFRDAVAAAAFRRLMYPREDQRIGERLRVARSADGLAYLEEPVNGVCVGAYFARGLVIVEGRLVVILSGDRSDARLMPVERLVEAPECARRALASLGIELLGPCLLHRVDLAAELSLDEGRAGVALLHASQRGLHLSRLSQVPHFAPGEPRVESIEWKTPKGNETRARLYDAGALHGTHQPGQRLRLEAQLRWNGTSAPTPEQLLERDPAALYGARLAPWLRSASGIHVAAPQPAIEMLYAQARSGERTRRSAESLAAKISTLTHARDLLEAHDYRRRVKALRDAGITLDLSGEVGPHIIDLHQPLAAFIAAWTPGPLTVPRPLAPPAATDDAPPSEPLDAQPLAADPDEQHHASPDNPAATTRPTTEPPRRTPLAPDIQLATAEEERAFARLMDKFPDLAEAAA